MKAVYQQALMAFEPLGFNHVIMVGWQSSEQADYAVCPHFHPDVFELHLVARGQVSYLIGGHYHTMCGGDILLIQPGVPHGTLEEPLGRCERYWLQLRAPQSGRSMLGLTAEVSQQIIGRLNEIPTLPFRTGKALVPVFEKIRAAYQDEAEPLRVTNLRNLILRSILDTFELTKPTVPSNGHLRIQEAVQFIENSHEPVILADLARAAGMSESAFKLLFRKTTGLPPMEYATRHRIEIARRLLISSNTPVTEVAHELGFSSSQHFATVFRRHTGLSPNEFRSGAAATHWHSEPIAGEGISFSPLIHLRP